MKGRGEGNKGVVIRERSEHVYGDYVRSVVTALRFGNSVDGVCGTTLVMVRGVLRVCRVFFSILSCIPYYLLIYLFFFNSEISEYLRIYFI